MVIDAKLNIKSDIFENINNFKYLSFLSLKNINFDKLFTTKLSSLKNLEFDSCHNVSISQESANNIRKLVLFSNNISSEIKLKFPELEIFKYQLFSDYSLLSEAVDLESMTKLTKIFIDMDENFPKIKNIDKLGIENLTLYTILNDVDKMTKTLEKIFKLKKLKKLNFGLININDEINDILPLLDQNDSVEKIHIIWLDGNSEAPLNNFQKKFPNASYLKIQEHTKKKNRV